MLRCGRACACRAWSICSDMVVWGIVGHTGRGAYRRLMLSGAGRGSPRPRTGLSPLQYPPSPLPGCQRSVRGWPHIDPELLCPRKHLGAPTWAVYILST